MPRTEALIVGEALIDVVRPQSGDVSEHVGGSPANVALALGRLQRPVKLLTWLGHDVYGDMVRRHLRKSGVEIIGDSVSASTTSVALARLGADGGATYEFDITWDLPKPDTIDEDPLVLHTGSLATAIEPGAAKVADLVKRLHGTATITYDPNIRPSLAGARERMRAHVLRMLTQSDVVKASAEDLAWLEPGIRPEMTITHWARLGPALAVLTRGGDGVLAVTSSGDKVDFPAVPVDVADTVGAGDTFMGALIDGLWAADLLGASNRDKLRSVDIDQVGGIVERAQRAAAFCVARPGAQPPTKAQLDGDAA